MRDGMIQTAEARAELRDILRSDTRRRAQAKTAWAQDVEQARSLLQLATAIATKRWRIRYRAAAAEMQRQIREKMARFDRVFDRGEAILAEFGRGVIPRGYQPDGIDNDPYRIGLDAPGDRYTPEEIVAACRPRVPQRWMPEELS